MMISAARLVHQMKTMGDQTARTLKKKRETEPPSIEIIYFVLFTNKLFLKLGSYKLL
jgi:hypothetical protein